jgi:hypothetical protein
MQHEIIEFIKSTNNRTRVNSLKSRPDVIDWLNLQYPNVPLLMQVQAIIHEKSPYCEVCNSSKKEIHASTCSRTCAQKHLKLTGQLDEKISKRHKTMIEKYGAKVSDKAREATKARVSSMNAKAKETLKKKYNVDNASQIPGHHQKCITTLQANYGTDHYTKTHEFKEKSRILQVEKLKNSLPESIHFFDLTDNLDKVGIFENPNKDVKFKCIICDTSEAVPTETVKWRIKNAGTCCTKCSGVTTANSVPQQELTNFINHELGIVTVNNTPVLGKQHIDIFIPEHNFGIEFNGLYWHTEEKKGKNYHNEKTKIANSMNISLFHVFEDEWTHTPEIVKSRIRNKLGLSTNKIFARKCVVQVVSTDEEKQFLLENHIQGYSKSSIKLGLYLNKELVSLMTFSKPSKSKGHSTDTADWELLRFCNKLNSNIVGGASKLFSHFIKLYNPQKILSFADRRYSDGNLYKTLGFCSNGDTRINYWYVDVGQIKRYHRFGLRKTSKDNQTLTEYQNRKLDGWSRIWDCGSSKWMWTRTN